MATNITGKNIELTEAIKSYINDKIAPLNERYDILAIDVEVDKNQRHNKGEVFHVRMNAQVPNALLRSEETKEDLYAAIDVCRDEIERQLRKRKSKYYSKRREAQKTQRRLKSIFSFWKKQ